MPSYTITRTLHSPEINRSLSICKSIKMPKEDIRLQFPGHTCINITLNKNATLFPVCTIHFQVWKDAFESHSNYFVPKKVGESTCKSRTGSLLQKRGLTRALETTAHILPFSLKALHSTTWVMTVMWAQSRYYIRSLYVGSWKLSDSRQLPWLPGLNRFPDQAESCKENEIQWLAVVQGDVSGI